MFFSVVSFLALHRLQNFPPCSFCHFLPFFLCFLYYFLSRKRMGCIPSLKRPSFLGSTVEKALSQFSSQLQSFGSHTSLLQHPCQKKSLCTLALVALIQRQIFATHYRSNLFLLQIHPISCDLLACMRKDLLKFSSVLLVAMARISSAKFLSMLSPCIFRQSFLLKSPSPISHSMS